MLRKVNISQALFYTAHVYSSDATLYHILTNFYVPIVHIDVSMRPPGKRNKTKAKNWKTLKCEKKYNHHGNISCPLFIIYDSMWYP